MVADWAGATRGSARSGAGSVRWFGAAAQSWERRLTDTRRRRRKPKRFEIAGFTGSARLTGLAALQLGALARRGQVSKLVGSAALMVSLPTLGARPELRIVEAPVAGAGAPFAKRHKLDWLKSEHMRGDRWAKQARMR